MWTAWSARALRSFSPAGLLIGTLFFAASLTPSLIPRETLIQAEREGLAPWREKLFVWMSRNALRATDFFQIPSNRVVEMGAQVEL